MNQKKLLMIVILLIQTCESSAMLRALYRARQQRVPQRSGLKPRYFSSPSSPQKNNQEQSLDQSTKIKNINTETQKTLGGTASGGIWSALYNYFWGKKEKSSNAYQIPADENPTFEKIEKIPFSKADELFSLFKYDIEHHGNPSKKTMHDLANAILEEGNRTFFNHKINNHSFLYWFIQSLIKDTPGGLFTKFENWNVKDIQESLRIITQMHNLGAQLDESDKVSLRHNLSKLEESLKYQHGTTIELKYMMSLARCYKLYAELGIVNNADKGIINVDKAIRFAKINMNTLLNDINFISIKFKDTVSNQLLKRSTAPTDKARKLEVAQAIEQYSMLYKLNFLNNPNDDAEKLFSEIAKNIQRSWNPAPEDFEMLVELAMQGDRNILNKDIEGHSLLFFVLEEIFDILWNSEDIYGKDKNNIMQLIQQLDGTGIYLNKKDKDVLRTHLYRFNPSEDAYYEKYPGDIPLIIVVRIARLYRLLLKLGVVDPSDNSIVNVTKCIEFSETNIDDSMLKEKLNDIEKKDKDLYENALFINKLKEKIEEERERIRKREEERAERQKKWEKEWEEIFRGKREETSGSRKHNTQDKNYTREKTPLEILGLTKSASAQDIKKAFYTYSQKHHSDKVKLTPEQLVEYKQVSGWYNDIKVELEKKIAEERRKKRAEREAGQ